MPPLKAARIGESAGAVTTTGRSAATAGRASVARPKAVLAATLVLMVAALAYGSGISDGNIHFHLDLPTLVVGGGAGTLKGGQHLRYKNDTPLANLYVSVLDKLGLPMDQFGDSTGKLDYLTGI